QLSSLKEILKKTQEENKFLLERQSESSNDQKAKEEGSANYRQDLESIKSTFIQGVQEAKAIELRYIDVLNEKIGLEHRYKNLEQEMHQLNVLIDQLKQKINDLELLSKEEIKTHGFRVESLQIQIETNEREKQQLEYSLNNKHNEIEYALKQIEELHREVEHQSTLNSLVKEQDALIQEQGQQLQSLEKDYQHVLSERDQLRHTLEDSESRLKVSQQHLAKKVKEATLLAERIEEQEVNLNDLMQTISQQKTQLVQLQGSVDFFQKEEKRLQDQLHETLKVTEAQVAKWEEKYFQMYEKWQSNEEIIRKLKKIEEKYEQMKGMLANLGAFVGTGIQTTPQTLVSNSPLASEMIEPPVKHIPKDLFIEETIRLDNHHNDKEEKLDLFGMRQSSDYYKQNFSYER
ncbi:MAG: hypothetical protein Q8K60_07535, partial [Parachlamydiaceae bacterium]|nr:hypothetical protein [Parachlamydiaceae bacterium]